MSAKKRYLTKRIINLYYPAMMVFFVFTLADNLLKKLVFDFSIETLLYVLLWLCMVIHITLARTRGIDWSDREYPLSALIADLFDVLCAIYLCSVIGGYKDAVLSSYLYISAPYIVVSVAQFLWFVFMRSIDVPALFRITILFIGMVGVSISEMHCHSIYNLLLIVILMVVLVILRIWDKVPFEISKNINRNN